MAMLASLGFASLHMLSGQEDFGAQCAGYLMSDGPKPPARRRMDRRHKYKPVGCCIYCGRTPPIVTLHLEHIVAESLGGMLELPEASCADCAKETHAYEGQCAGRLFAPIRAQIGFPSKRTLRNRVKKFTMTFDGVRRKIHQDEYPGMVISFVNGLPGILVGALPTENYSGGIAMTTLPGFGERLNKLRAKFRAGEVQFNPEFDIQHLGRMLAKIAHGYATAELGLGSFCPLLLNIILNRPPLHISHYVGGIRDQEPPEGTDLHEIEIDTTGLGLGRYVVVRIQLFADRKLPVYYVVAGAIADRL
jgi:hypothetical protein